MPEPATRRVAFADATIDIESFAEPIAGVFTLLPPHASPRLNQLALRDSIKDAEPDDRCWNAIIKYYVLL